MMFKRKKFEIPIFKEKYSLCLKPLSDIAIYRCELIDKNGEILSFGIARTSIKTVNHRFGREISYARAMRFFFLKKYSHKQIIDTTDKPCIGDWTNGNKMVCC